MAKHRVVALVLISLVQWSVAASAVRAQAAPIKVFVSHSGSDPVGTRLAYEVKELLQASKLYPLSTVSDGAQVELSLVTVDADEQHASSAVSVAVVLNNGSDRLLDQEVRIVGRTRTQDQAASIVAKIDRNVAEVRRSATAAPRATPTGPAPAQLRFSFDVPMNTADLPFDPTESDINTFFGDLVTTVVRTRQELALLRLRVAKMEAQQK